jgi:hypothetical protein
LKDRATLILDLGISPFDQLKSGAKGATKPAANPPK